MDQPETVWLASQWCAPRCAAAGVFPGLRGTNSLHVFRGRAGIAERLPILPVQGFAGVAVFRSCCWRAAARSAGDRLGDIPCATVAQLRSDSNRAKTSSGGAAPAFYTDIVCSSPDLRTVTRSYLRLSRFSSVEFRRDLSAVAFGEALPLSIRTRGEVAVDLYLRTVCPWDRALVCLSVTAHDVGVFPFP